MSNPCEPLSASTIGASYRIDVAGIAPLGTGLINQTFRVDAADGRRLVLQRLHEIFPASVNEDIDIVTRHLRARGMTAPVLLPTAEGELWLDLDDGVWRMMTYVAGDVVERIESDSRAREAGALLGRFHVALSDLGYGFPNARTGIHDTARHLDNLRSAISTHSGHADFSRIEPLAQEILAAADTLPTLADTPRRVVHGDPKISNFIFDPATGRGVCLVDLDTLNRMPLPLELGDAMRSWCNPAGEDTVTTGFSTAYFRAALSGYALQVGDWITLEERKAIVSATLTVMVELAARFCADALQERYFGWDPERFPSRSEHNRVRATGQLAAYRECHTLSGELEEIVDFVFDPAGPA
jgi:Ser/Thr protein kinase RdoA (MazF antagonist)